MIRVAPPRSEIGLCVNITRKRKTPGGSMNKMSERLALHTWSLDTTPLPAALAAARDGGWNAVELRRIDFTRCFDKGMTNENVIDLVRESGMKVAVLGTEYGLLFAT